MVKKSKSFIACLLAVLMILTTVPLSLASGEDVLGYAYCNDNENEYYAVESCNIAASGDVVIPSKAVTDEHGELPVKAISGYAFINCSAIENIYIPRSVTYIDVNAFKSQNAATAGNLSVTLYGYEGTAAEAFASEFGIIYKYIFCEHEKVDENVGAKEATCSAEGYTGDKVCKKCEEVLEKGTTIEKLPHTYNDGEITTPATCTEKGVKTFTCTECGAQKTEEVEKIAHKCELVLNGNKKDSTCAEEGYIEKALKCTGCGEVFNTIKLTVAKKAHTPGEAVKENEVAATCSTEGSYDSVVYCTVCKGEISREKITTEKDPNNHTFSAWHTEKASTCKTNGVIVRKCTGCDKTETGPLELNPNNHTYDDGNVTTAPTCIKAGIKTFTCTECGDQKTEEVPIDPGAHTPGEAKEENRVEATCTSNGSYNLVVRCKDCGSIISSESETINKLPHTYGDWTVTKEATCVAKGEERRVCENCEDFETREIEVNPDAHNPEKIIVKDAKDATCKELGYTGDKYCSDCNNLVQMGEYIPTIPHTEEVIPAVAATCTKTGLTEGKKCSVCGETLVAQETVQAKGHTPGEAKEENRVEATCTSNGSYNLVVRCKDCDSIISSESKTIEKLPHTYGDWTVTKEATCVAKGEERRKCENCEAFETRETEKDPNNHVNGYETRNEKEATCKEKGYTGDLCCVDCKAVLEKGEETHINRANHAGETEIKNAKKATCTADGYTGDVYCLDCGVRIKKGETVKAKGHTDEDKDGRCDVCEAEYYTHETCPCRCHKSGFDKFLFKLMLFFQMLFEKNKVCKCGDLHY